MSAPNHAGSAFPEPDSTVDQPLPELRWNSLWTQAPILQQRWLITRYRGQVPIDQRQEWRDVPMVRE